MASAAPVSDRLVSLDAVRGLAVLGIFAMNIQTFAMVLDAYTNPPAHLDFTGINRALWMISHVFFDLKFITIFSALFGAGVAMTVRAGDFVSEGRHFKRMFWLLLLGLIHAYGFWYGDILVSYAVWGAAAVMFLRYGAGSLAATGLVLVIVTAVMFWSQYAAWDSSAGFLSPEQWRPSASELRETTEIARAAWGERIWRWAGETLNVQLSGVVYYGPRTLGCMLLGMALYRNGFLTGAWSARRYAIALLASLPAGLAVAWAAAEIELAGEFLPGAMKWGSLMNHIASLAVAFGYACLVMLACRPAVLRLAVAPFAAVGRMALTNYLLQTLVGWFLFYGPPGLGWFGAVERTGQGAIVLAVWAAQLILSPLWLAAFRYGPAEWGWRSLTYGRLQPFLGGAYRA